MNVATANLDPIVSKCAHEAGHALVAIEANTKVHRVEVRDGASGVLCDSPDLPASGGRPTAEQRAGLVRAVHIVLAGPVAECVFKGDSGHRARVVATEVDLLNLLVGASNDVATADNYARAIYPDERERMVFIVSVFARLMQWLLSNKSTLTTVCAALYRRRVLNESDVAALMNACGCIPLFDRDGAPRDLLPQVAGVDARTTHESNTAGRTH